MNKVSIVLKKSMTNGQKANCAAILMGQLVEVCPDIYEMNPISDPNGIPHASIKNNVIVLETNENKLIKLLDELKEFQYVVFTDIGQSYSNSFENYKKDLLAGKEYSVVGIAIYGNQEAISYITKKFSLYK